MNKDQIQGSAKNIVGIVQEGAGKLIGSQEQEVKGIQKQLAGKAERLVGDAKEILQDAKDSTKKAAP